MKQSNMLLPFMLSLSLVLGCQTVWQMKVEFPPPPKITLTSITLFNYDVPATTSITFEHDIEIVLRSPCYFPLHEPRATEVQVNLEKIEPEIADMWLEILDAEGAIQEILQQESPKRIDLTSSITLRKTYHVNHIDTWQGRELYKSFSLRLVFRTKSGDTKQYEFQLHRHVEAPHGFTFPTIPTIPTIWESSLLHKRVTSRKLLLYAIIGLPRDICDVPFTFIYNHYYVPVAVGVGGGIAAAIGWYGYSIYKYGGIGPHFSHLWSRCFGPIFEGIGILAVGLGVAAAPGALMPIETLIFRYPADKNVLGFEDKIEGWVSYKNPHYLDESPLLYFPNFYYIFYELDEKEYKKQEEYKNRLALREEALALREKALALRDKVTTSFRVWYSLEY